MIIKISLIRIVFAICSGFSYMVTGTAQALHFQHFTVENGLPSSTVYGAYQDQNGFMWFGTESGLCRYDGTEFKTYTSADGLPANTVLNITEAWDGRLWFSCYNEGVAYYDQGQFFSAKNDSAVAQMNFKSVHALSLQTDNYLFLYDYHKVYEIQKKNAYPLFRAYQWPQKDMEKRRLTSVKDTLFVFSWSRTPDKKYIIEVSKRTGQQLTPIYQYKTQSEKVPFSKETAYDNYFFYVDDKTLKTLKIIEGSQVVEQIVTVFKSPIRTISTPAKGQIWVETANEGLFCVDYNDNGFKQPVFYPGIRNVNYVLLDREGITWFTTADNGVLALHNRVNLLINQSNGLKSNRIMSLERSFDGGVWIGDASDYLLKWRSGKIEVEKKMTRNHQFNRLLDICADAATQNTWVTTDQGLFKLNKQGYVSCIYPFSTKTIWLQNHSLYVGTGSQLLVFPRLSEKHPLAVSNTRTMAITQDMAGNIWQGKLNGLEIHRGDRTICLEQKHPDLLKTRITGLAATSGNLMWVATHENGVIVIKDDTIIAKKITVSDGLTGNICQNLRVDSRGYVWVSTSSGLNRIDPRTFNVSKYSNTNVLPDNDVNDVLVLGDTVWAATSKGIAIFNDSVKSTNPEFRTLVTDIFVNGVSYPISVINYLTLPPDSCDLRLRFAALSFRSRGNFQYYYEIRQKHPGLWYLTWQDLSRTLKEWWIGEEAVVTNTISGNNLSLSNMPPGVYSLKLTGISFDGIRSLFPGQVNFAIRPGILHMLWFWVFWMVLLIWAGWRYYHLKLHKKEQELRVQQEMAVLKLEAFKAQINPHFIFNTINGIQRFFFPPDPGKANTYLTLFSNLLRKTLDYSEKTTLPFHQELAFLKEYLELTRLRVGDKFEYEITGVPNVPALTEIPTMLLQPLVENAIVHGFPSTGKARLILSFIYANQRLICRVEDNGPGIRASLKRRMVNTAQRQSKGTLLVRQRIDALNHLLHNDIQLSVTDKADLQRPDTGTIAEVSFQLFG